MPKTINVIVLNLQTNKLVSSQKNMLVSFNFKIYTVYELCVMIHQYNPNITLKLLRKKTHTYP